MKVSVAAKVMSHTAAATIEAFIGSGSEQLPAEAIYTAEFIEDTDSLFDSLNAQNSKLTSGKPLRRSVSKKSGHIHFWKNMLQKINTWEFHPKNGGKIKKSMPFKTSWMITIRGVMELFEICSKKGFRFLRTRSLNQDPLKYNFAVIRQNGAANTNPNCFQFTSGLKTWVLNSLITPKNSNKNCENDGSTILNNLNSFSTCGVEPEPSFNLVNELNELVIPNFNIVLSDSAFDTKALTYVAGFIIKKLKKLNCENCMANLLTNTLETHHIFTMFEENDDNLRLNYVKNDVIVLIAKMTDIINRILPEYGHILNIIEKIKSFLIDHLNFDWFKCSCHSFSKILDISIPLIVKKFFDDMSMNIKKQKRKK
ncbi:hypothetical protein JTB14_038020 [Gonioctena quinquepunctata]|nr:hypothetical protein JTB14_038020 [Gonioctena quinquepunctata]